MSGGAASKEDERKDEGNDKCKDEGDNKRDDKGKDERDERVRQRAVTKPPTMTSATNDHDE